jgi:hypothetical protein
MTKRLEEAFAKASKLPEKEQDSLAAWLMEELEDEHAWEEKFAKSHDVLARLAKKALAEHRAGKTRPLDPDGL